MQAWNGLDRGVLLVPWWGSPWALHHLTFPSTLSSRDHRDNLLGDTPFPSLPFPHSFQCVLGHFPNKRWFSWLCFRVCFWGNPNYDNPFIHTHTPLNTHLGPEAVLSCTSVRSNPEANGGINVSSIVDMTEQDPVYSEVPLEFDLEANVSW